MWRSLFLLTTIIHLNFARHNYTHFWNHVQINYYKLGNSVIFKESIEGCIIKENSLMPLTCIIGYDCKNFPRGFKTNNKLLKLKMTGIQKIKTEDFTEVKSLTALSIEYNLELNELQPGCFSDMLRLVYLKITLNPKLKHLDQNIFKDLISLEHLTLRKNGFEHIPDLSIAMRPSILPNLKYLDLSENSLKTIDKNDFISMNGSALEEIKFTLCDISYIHEESLVVFRQLSDLDFGQNHCTADMITKLILKLVDYDIRLEVISLYDLGYREKPPMDILRAIAKSNVTNLSLAKNQLEELTKNDFPPMPQIKSLDLSDNLIVSFENDTFQGFPKLEELLLAGNKFTRIFPAFLLPQLKVLDLRLLTGKISAVSYLSIPNNMFCNMRDLKDLALSYNLIDTITRYTFKGLDNLIYLELKNATIYNIEKGSFRDLKELDSLNLENNVFKTLIPTQEIFDGLDNLKTLLFGGSGISNLSVYPSPFTFLPNLMYLGLNNNALSSLSPHVFAPLKKLKILDLSNNKLIPWTDRLIVNPGLAVLSIQQNKFTFFTNAMLNDFENVEFVHLDGNPIVCDCNLFPENFDVTSLLHKYENKSKMFDVKCSYFEMKQQKTILDFINFIKKNPEYCKSGGSTNKMITMVLLSVFLILVAIFLGLSYVYRHYIRYWLFLAKIALQKHSKWWKRDYCKQHPSLKYDAFVSYSCEDFLFVNKLVFELEENDPKLKLCLYERDFRIGSIISEEVLHAVLRSKRTLLVISDNFAKSHWCRWETKLAEYHQIFFKNDNGNELDDTLVMIKLNHVTKKYVTPTLKYLMKTRIYLEYNEKKEKEFWKKLKNTLISQKNHKNITSIT